MSHFDDDQRISRDVYEAFDLGAAGNEIQSELPILESGSAAGVVIYGDHVVKTSNRRVTAEEVLAERRHLVAYADALEREPIAVAPLSAVAVLRDGDRYRLSYMQELVRGPSVARLPEEERRQAVAQIVGRICLMSTLEQAPDVLQVGIDAVTRNWHIAADGTPTLTDIYRPLVREPDSMLEKNRYYEKYFGTKSGAITRLLHSSVTFSEVGLGSLAPLKQGAEEWLYDTVPEDADPAVRKAVHRQLRLRFAPFIASAILNKARFKSGH